ncbi:MAG TPA: hypothetical protein VKU02_18025 [Gemmataceae bacterium]|nr:hypothetical protein [Gemmataceae bacterium]
MLIWTILLTVCGAGAVGGIINALMSDNGFILPQAKKVEDGVSILRPGFLGNLFIGAVAAGVSWGLYGPLATYIILGSDKALASNPAEGVSLSVTSLVGAVLVGVGGARWLTNEVDKSLLKAAATKAAVAQPAPLAVAQQLALASPSQALDIANGLKR